MILKIAAGTTIGILAAGIIIGSVTLGYISWQSGAPERAAKAAEQDAYDRENFCYALEKRVARGGGSRDDATPWEECRRDGLIR